MEDKSRVWKAGPHFVDPENKKEPFAVAGGMRFRKPDGTVVVVPQPTPPEPKKD